MSFHRHVVFKFMPLQIQRIGHINAACKSMKPLNTHLVFKIDKKIIDLRHNKTKKMPTARISKLLHGIREKY